MSYIQFYSENSFSSSVWMLSWLYFIRLTAVFCRSGEEQSHKSPTPGGGPDEYRRAVSLFSFILRTRLAYDVSTNLER